MLLDVGRAAGARSSGGFCCDVRGAAVVESIEAPLSSSSESPRSFNPLPFFSILCFLSFLALSAHPHTARPA